MDLLEGFESAVPSPQTPFSPEDTVLSLSGTVAEFLRYVTRSQEHAATLLEQVVAELPVNLRDSEELRTSLFARGLELVSRESLPLPEPEYAALVEEDPFRAAIARLPFEYRVVFLLQDRYGFSREELTGMLGWSQELIRQLSLRARLMVRRNLLRFLNGETV